MSNNYNEKIQEAIKNNLKINAEKILVQEHAVPEKTNVEKMKELASTTRKTSRALFSDDTADKILNHKTNYKLEE